MKQAATLYLRHRFPAAIIQHAVWLYHRFNLSHRDIEDLLAERGVEVSYESFDCGATSSVRCFRND
jgi:transposase-like protein